MTSAKTPPSLRELDEPKLEALIETMFLAAYADGEFSDEERKHFVASIESLTDRSLGGDTLEKLIARITHELETEGRAARLASVKARLATPEARKTALALTIQVAAADGIIRTSEREMILDVAEALEIDRDVAANLVKRLAPGDAPA